MRPLKDFRHSFHLTFLASRPSGSWNEWTHMLAVWVAHIRLHDTKCSGCLPARLLAQPWEQENAEIQNLRPKVLRNNYKSWVRSPTGPARCSASRKNAKMHSSWEKPVPLPLKKKKKQFWHLAFCSSVFLSIPHRVFLAFKCQTVHFILFLDLLF